MAVKVVWDNDACTIIRVEIQGEWTWSEMHSALTQTVEMMDEQECTRADLIVDVSRATIIPSLALPNARSISQRRDPRMNMTVLVGMSDVMRALLNAFLQVYNTVGRKERYVLVKNLDAARALLARQTEQQPTR
jgi:hypothetical protein